MIKQLLTLCYKLWSSDTPLKWCVLCPTRIGQTLIALCFGLW